MLQSSGKVARKKMRPVSKVSNQKPSSHQSTDPVHITSANHQTSSGTSPAGDSSTTLPAEVEQIFEVNISTCVTPGVSLLLL